MSVTKEHNRFIIEKLKSGCEETFDNIYRSFFPGLCSFAAQYVPFHEAHEIVQTTMLWLWEHKNVLEPELSLRSLLFTIVRNRAINSVNHIQIKDRVHRNIAAKFSETFDSPALYMEKELFELFNKALEKLPEDVRYVFEKNRFDGITHRQIAQELGVSVQTVNYRICLALNILRQELKDYLPIIMLLFMVDTGSAI